MTDTSPVNRTTPEPHPVAALLTDEMRERVRAARFYRDDDPDREMRAAIVADISDQPCCPMGVALGGGRLDLERFPIGDMIAAAIGKDDDAEVIKIVDEFINLVDDDKIPDPADVYVLLGCEPAAPSPTGGAQ